MPGHSALKTQYKKSLFPFADSHKCPNYSSKKWPCSFELVMVTSISFGWTVWFCTYRTHDAPSCLLELPAGRSSVTERPVHEVPIPLRKVRVTVIARTG